MFPLARREFLREVADEVFELHCFDSRRFEAQRRKERSEAHLHMDVDVSGYRKNSRISPLE